MQKKARALRQAKVRRYKQTYCDGWVGEGRNAGTGVRWCVEGEGETRGVGVAEGGRRADSRKENQIEKRRAKFAISKLRRAGEGTEV